MTIHLGRPLPDASRDLPGRRAENAPLPSLLGLAPGGVYRAVTVAGDAVRSYRTLSPLPGSGSRHCRAVCFLWHFPWGRPRRALPGTVFSWSPDFPPPGWFPVPEGGHPTVWRVRYNAFLPDGNSFLHRAGLRRAADGGDDAAQQGPRLPVEAAIDPLRPRAA